MRLGALWGRPKGPTVTTTGLEDAQPWNWPPLAGYSILRPFILFARSRATWRTRARSRRYTRARRPPGQEWMQGALFCAYIAMGIAGANVIFTLVAVGIAYSRPSHARSFSRFQLYHGHCNRTSHWATGIHIVINIFSTALLTASSHAMQCVCAPTREDVDQAHKQRRWLDIGVVSWRNFRIMNTKRKILWILLLLSSTPIHMLYNSVVYASIVTYNYGMLLIPNDLSPTEPLVQANYPNQFYTAVGSTPEIVLTEIFNGTFMNMTNEECLNNYDVQYNTQLSTLIFVAERRYFNNESSLSALMDGYTSIYDYTSGDGTDIAKDAIANNDWTAQGMTWNLTVDWGYMDLDLAKDIPISHCMAKRASQRCELLFSPSIALAVIVCNIIKAICMFVAARTDRPGILLRVGDAVASFLSQPDTNTQGRCLMSRADMTQGPYQWEPLPDRVGLLRRRTRSIQLDDLADIRLEDGHTLRPGLHGHSPRKLSGRKRWFQAASWKRWIWAILLYSICIGLPSWWYHALVSLSQWSLADQWSLGFGSPSFETGLNFGTSNILALVLLTNSPQLFFSILYFLSKNLLSCMLVTAEYNDYATQRKPLRVSWPKGSQRSTYYLTLPARYSVPLFIMSAAMHWLLSESFYSVDWNVYSVFGKFDPNDSPDGCGFSPMAILLTLILLGMALSTLLILGARRFKSPMPIAAHCSAAISAACHPPDGDKDAALHPLMWGGVVDTGASRVFQERPTRTTTETGSQTEDPYYCHCTFTSQAVVAPSMSRLYI
ncbi:uncharacterized protein BO97DRAFT_397376 [Aspergillus homomorphus CBS 101889]|uniref:DUF6536 domain-containing protein n=1 Tax=Aspergillus homomorphus (strain CBS 101889) TaxID=1450537 RepID=A0A395HNH3_ASPHC|nr:hypothetical protein BO97DRAFT_397376 [Aspergillus homomorphus CBS 101889]RAL08825.1 hypothetical protein BO97DRAFT_397376 [Aspergillus homomorphus CBS 101889]